MVQERLWITEPRRATCLGEVTEVRGQEFLLDRALFAPRSRACRHPQNHDEGTLWWDGEKRRLGSVREAGDVWYTLRGTVPDVGVTLQCQLDQDVRDLASRAHSAMHLMLAALPDVANAPNLPPLVEDPEVKGGGHFRLTFAWPVPAETLAGALRAVQAAVAFDHVVQRTYAPKAEVERRVTQQSFQPPDPVPGPDVLPLVKIGETIYPCDGTHVERTAQVGRVLVSHAAPGKEGFVVGGRVE